MLRPNLLKKGYEAFAEIINPRIKSGNAEDNIKSVKRTVESWMSPFLVVLDNHDDPKSFNNLQAYFPESRFSSILITSRRSDVAALANYSNDIELHGLDKEEAYELLLRQSSRKDDERSRADEPRIVNMENEIFQGRTPRNFGSVG